MSVNLAAGYQYRLCQRERYWIAKCKTQFQLCYNYNHLFNLTVSVEQVEAILHSLSLEVLERWSVELYPNRQVILWCFWDNAYNSYYYLVYNVLRQQVVSYHYSHYRECNHISTGFSFSSTIENTFAELSDECFEISSPHSVKYQKPLLVVRNGTKVKSVTKRQL